MYRYHRITLMWGYYSSKNCLRKYHPVIMRKDIIYSSLVMKYTIPKEKIIYRSIIEKPITVPSDILSISIYFLIIIIQSTLTQIKGFVY